MAKKQKLNLIEELTTHKVDFQYWPLHIVRPAGDNRPREEPLPKPVPQFVSIDPQSHAPHKPSVHIPFDLYVPPKPIVGTDPRECFKIRKPPKYKKNRDGAKLNTILPPCLPMTEIESEDDLDIILNYSYNGVQKIALEEAAFKIKKRTIPPNRVVNDPCNVNFKSNLYPPLPPGWIAAAKHWECLQTRSLGDPFKTFWTRRGHEVECSCCCNRLPNILSQETKDEIAKLNLENKLRLPYDVTITGYGGYRPFCAKGVPLQKS